MSAGRGRLHHLCGQQGEATIRLEALEYYSVQPILDDGTIDKTNTRNVAASSPLKAAEEAIGLPLALVGSRARALVWRMTAGYVPATITLYDAETIK